VGADTRVLGVRVLVSEEERGASGLYVRHRELSSGAKGILCVDLRFNSLLIHEEPTQRSGGVEALQHAVHVARVAEVAQADGTTLAPFIVCKFLLLGLGVRRYALLDNEMGSRLDNLVTVPVAL
jgi:hypothetical protein